jgi:predicted porin
MTLKMIALRHGLAAAALAFSAFAAQAQTDYSAYGVLDFSYGRFEPSGEIRQDRFSSNSLSASFVGVNLKHGFDGGWTPGVTLEAFVRFQDFQLGRSQNDPALSRKAFVSLASDYGTVNVGRLQTFLFDSTTRFNALGNSTVFSPAIRHIFSSGNLEGVQGDFYWNRAVSYLSPSIEGVTANVMYALGAEGLRSDLSSLSVIFSRGLFAASMTAQKVHRNDGFNDPTDETTWQIGGTYNFGWARLFGLYTHTGDTGLDVRSRIASAGVAVPVGPGTLQAQFGYTTADGPAVDRRHASTGAAYLYAYDSVTDIYVAALEDRIRGQTNGLSLATGVRFRF